MSEPKSVTREDLEGLPLRAVVAFAARCARRVVPLFTHWAREAGRMDHAEEIERAVQVAEGSGAGLPVARADARADANAAANAATNARHAAFRAVAAFRPVADAAANAATAARAAAYAAAYAADARTAAYAADSAADAVTAARAAAKAAVYAAAAADAADAATGRDFLMLKEAIKVSLAPGDAVFPPDFFGHLWPDGEPPGWLSPPDGGGIAFNIDIPDDATDEEVMEGLKALADAADELHRALGGHGLKIDRLEITEEALAPVPKEVPR